MTERRKMLVNLHDDCMVLAKIFHKADLLVEHGFVSYQIGFNQNDTVLMQRGKEALNKAKQVMNKYYDEAKVQLEFHPNQQEILDHTYDDMKTMGEGIDRIIELIERRLPPEAIDNILGNISSWIDMEAWNVVECMCVDKKHWQKIKRKKQRELLKRKVSGRVR